MKPEKNKNDLKSKVIRTDWGANIEFELVKNNNQYENKDTSWFSLILRYYQRSDVSIETTTKFIWIDPSELKEMANELNKLAVVLEGEVKKIDDKNKIEESMTVS